MQLLRRDDVLRPQGGVQAQNLRVVGCGVVKDIAFRDDGSVLPSGGFLRGVVLREVEVEMRVGAEDDGQAGVKQLGQDIGVPHHDGLAANAAEGGFIPSDGRVAAFVGIIYQLLHPDALLFVRCAVGFHFVPAQMNRGAGGQQAHQLIQHMLGEAQGERVLQVKAVASSEAVGHGVEAG